MEDKKIDELLKKEIQKEEILDKRFDDLFEMYKEKYKNERGINMKKSKTSFIQKMRYVAAVLVVGVLCGTGGMTYAHIKGAETLISPLLRNIGVESKYEENATKLNDSVTVKTEKIELLNAAIDDSTLIAGYKISMPDVKLESWIEVVGEYQINGFEISPVNTTIEKTEGENGTEYIYYQIFDLNEIDFGTIENLNFDVNIFEINEYVEVEDLMSASIEYLEKYVGNWEFENDIPVKNIEENKVFELNAEAVEYKDIVFDAKKIVKSSYTNMITIQTDKSKYEGDAFEVYYIIYDEKGNEIAAGCEIRNYDERVYNDRLFIADIEKNSEIKIDIYFNDINVGKYEKIDSIEVNFDNIKQVIDSEVEYVEYEENNYIFKYNKEWNVDGILDKEDVGPLSRYNGSLRLTAPSTTNQEYGMSLNIVKKVGDDVEKYIEELRTGYENEYSEFKSKEECTIGKIDGYKLVMSNPESSSVVYAIEIDGNIYDLTFSGDEKEINNRKADIEMIVKSFEVK